MASMILVVIKPNRIKKNMFYQLLSTDSCLSITIKPTIYPHWFSTMISARTYKFLKLIADIRVAMIPWKLFVIQYISCTSSCSSPNILWFYGMKIELNNKWVGIRMIIAVFKQSITCKLQQCLSSKSRRSNTFDIKAIASTELVTLGSES